MHTKKYRYLFSLTSAIAVTIYKNSRGSFHTVIFQCVFEWVTVLPWRVNGRLFRWAFTKSRA